VKTCVYLTLHRGRRSSFCCDVGDECRAKQAELAERGYGAVVTSRGSFRAWGGGIRSQVPEVCRQKPPHPVLENKKPSFSFFHLLRLTPLCHSPLFLCRHSVAKSLFDLMYTAFFASPLVASPTSRQRARGGKGDGE